MFHTFDHTRALLAMSLRVLRKEGLLAFPLASAVSLLAVFLYVLVAFQYGGTFARLRDGFHVLPADVIFLGLAYVSASFVMTYFTAALVAALHYRSMGGVADLRFGLEAANDRLGAIALWSGIAATIGLVLRPLVSGRGRLERLGGRREEFYAGRASVLVLPVMMGEGATPLDAMRRATELLQETWGRPAGKSGFGLLYPALLGAAFGVAGVFLLVGTSAGFAAIAAMTLFALAVATVKCLETVFVVALYNYVTVGESDSAFTDVLRNAYVYKEAKGGIDSPAARRRAAA